MRSNFFLNNLTDGRWRCRMHYHDSFRATLERIRDFCGLANRCRSIEFAVAGERFGCLAANRTPAH